MTNSVRGEASCTLADGTFLNMVVDFEALACAEEAADMGVNDLLASLNSGDPRMKPMRAIVFGALQAKHADISLKQVGDMLLADRTAEIASALGRAVAGAFGEQTGGVENPPTPLSGAGTDSSATGRQKG